MFLLDLFDLLDDREELRSCSGVDVAPLIDPVFESDSAGSILAVAFIACVLLLEPLRLFATDSALFASPEIRKKTFLELNLMTAKIFYLVSANSLTVLHRS